MGIFEHLSVLAPSEEGAWNHQVGRNGRRDDHHSPENLTRTHPGRALSHTMCAAHQHTEHAITQQVLQELCSVLPVQGGLQQVLCLLLDVCYTNKVKEARTVVVYIAACSLFQ